MRKSLAIALAAALLAAPIPGHAQDITLKKGYIGTSDMWLTVPGVAAEQGVVIVAPRNYAELIRNGTLRELELAVPLGAANDALARSHRSRAPIANLRVKVRDQSGRYMQFKLTNAMVTSYSVNASGLDDQDKFGRVKIQFHWDRTEQSQRPQQLKEATK